MNYRILCSIGFVCVICSWIGTPTSGQTLLKDVKPGVANGSNPTLLTNVNGTLFFVADDGVHGRELWKSDGTAAGTVLVKDINPGPQGSDIHDMVVVNNLLFFSAFSTIKPAKELVPSNSRQIWRSDGTDVGTFEPYDGHKDGEVKTPVNLTKVGGRLYYVTRGSLGGTDQWLLSSSDGTNAEPNKPGGTGSFYTFGFNSVTDGINPPANFTDVNGELYFTYQGAVWKTVGQLTDPSFTVTKIQALPAIRNLCAYNKKLYFSNKAELWTSAGSPTTTKKVATMGTVADSIRSLTSAGNYLYIVTGKEGRALFASNGATVSAKPQAIAPGFIRAITYFLSGKSPMPTPSLTYFMAANELHTLNPNGWVLNKMPGTYLGVTNFVRAGNALYFITSSGLSRITNGTNKVESVFSIPVSFSTFSLTNVGSRLYFSTLLPNSGQEVYYVNVPLTTNPFPKSTASNE